MIYSIASQVIISICSLPKWWFKSLKKYLIINQVYLNKQLYLIVKISHLEETIFVCVFLLCSKNHSVYKILIYTSSIDKYIMFKRLRRLLFVRAVWRNCGMRQTRDQNYLRHLERERERAATQLEHVGMVKMRFATHNWWLNSVREYIIMGQ